VLPSCVLFRAARPPPKVSPSVRPPKAYEPLCNMLFRVVPRVLRRGRHDRRCGTGYALAVTVCSLAHRSGCLAKKFAGRLFV
jgi:hypothetical protein